MTIHLRKITSSDYDTDLCISLLNENIQCFYNDKAVTKKSHLKFLEKYFAKQDEIIWVIEQDGKGVGIISLVHIDLKNKKSEWGRFVLSDEVKGQGLGVLVLYGLINYAFESLGLNKLYCEALKENQIAVNLYNKLGFEKEGEFKDWIYKNGKFMDIIFLSLSAESWKKLYKPKFDELFKNKTIVTMED